jgi:hypothetical protein
LTKYLPKELTSRELEVGADVIRSYSATRKIPDERMVAKHLENVVVLMASIHKDDVSLLSKNSHSIGEQKKVCSISIEMYEHILRLPKEQSIPLLRYMFAQ